MDETVPQLNFFHVKCDKTVQFWMTLSLDKRAMVTADSHKQNEGLTSVVHS